MTCPVCNHEHLSHDAIRPCEFCGFVLVAGSWRTSSESWAGTVFCDCTKGPCITPEICDANRDPARCNHVQAGCAAKCAGDELAYRR